MNNWLTSCGASEMNGMAFRVLRLARHQTLETAWQNVCVQHTPTAQGGTVLRERPDLI